MIEREDNTFDKVVKVGLALSQTKKFAAADK
jgi:hypothetical protein